MNDCELTPALMLVAAEFPEWEVKPARWGMWSAWWQSPDGRSRRYVVAGSAPELLQRLRTIACGGS